MQEALGTNIRKRKKIIRNVGIAFLAIILLLTFFSKSINNFLLPTVEYTNTVKGSLEWTVMCNGEVRLLDTEKIYALDSWKIKDVFVKVDSEVTKGTLLATLDTDDIRISLENMELEIARMTNDLENYKSTFAWIDITPFETDAGEAQKLVTKYVDEVTDTKDLYESGSETLKSLHDAEGRLEDAKEDYAKKLSRIDEKKQENEKLKLEYDRNVKEKILEIDVKKLQYKKNKNEIPDNGQIKAPIDGTVQSVSIEKGSECTSGQILFELVSKNSKVSVQWRLNTEKAKLVDIGNEVDMKVQVPDELVIKGKVIKKEFLTEENMFQYTSDIDTSEPEIDGKPVFLKNGQTAELESDKRSNVYDYIVPNSCIIQAGNEQYVFLLEERTSMLGVEDYAKKVKIKVLDKDDFSSAINIVSFSGDPSCEKIATYSSKVLEDGMQISIKE